MNTTIALIFLVTYAGVALGRIPGLALDRTGIALLGAIAMVSLGALNTQEAVNAIDFPTILLLYALMVVSAQFRLAGFYTWVALKVARQLDHPKRFLLLLMLTSAGLSAILANDIVCLAFTPVLTVTLTRRFLNPIPYLVALAVSSNIGSAATIIGNPQNMLIGQVGNLNFQEFLLWSLPPALASLAAAYLIILVLSRNCPPWTGSPLEEAEGTWPAFDAHQSRKAIVYTSLLMVLFFTPVPRHMAALVVAACLLCSRRMKTRSILGLVDWHLITLFCSLFILIAAVEKAGLPRNIMAILDNRSLHLTDPYTLAAVSVVLSNATSNVPAVMLLTKFLPPGNDLLWYVLAASSTYAGNLITIGSIANLIVIEEAAACGVPISFSAHARYGVPITLASLVILVLWIRLTG